MPFSQYLIQLWQTTFVIPGPQDTKHERELPLRSSYCFIEHGNWPSLCGCFRVSTRHVFTHMLQVEARRVMTNICRLQESHEYSSVGAHEYSSVGECHQIILIYCAIPSCSSVCTFLSMVLVLLCASVCVCLLVCHCIQFLVHGPTMDCYVFSQMLPLCWNRAMYTSSTYFQRHFSRHWIVSWTAIHFSYWNPALFYYHTACAGGLYVDMHCVML